MVVMSTDSLQNSADFQAFRTQALRALQSVEQRRSAMVMQFWLGLILIPIVAVIAFSLTISWFEGVDSLFDYACVAFFYTMLSIWLIARPIFRYRRHAGAPINAFQDAKPYSLKEHCYGNLFQYFGDFTYRNLADVEDLTTHGISPRHFHEAPNVAAFDEYRAEDHVMGRVNNAKVELSEAQLVRRRGGERTALFRGLAIVVDIDEVKSRLRGPFNGMGVAIADFKKDAPVIQREFENWQRIDLKNAALEQHFEAFTTNEEEAEAIFTPKMLHELLTLQESLKHAKDQHVHDDEKILVALARGVAKVFAAGSTLSLMGRKSLHAHYDITDDVSMNKFEPLADGKIAQALNESIECSFFRDRVLITIPYTHDFFEPNSLFEPAIHEGDLELVYSIMRVVNLVAMNVTGAKDALNKQSQPA